MPNRIGSVCTSVRFTRQRLSKYHRPPDRMLEPRREASRQVISPLISPLKQLLPDSSRRSLLAD